MLGVYLLGAAAWGIPFIAALLCFKGFGTGVTAGWLCVTHGLSGAGFYLLVLLPGTFIFCAVLIGFSVRAFAFSKLVFRYSLSRQTPAETLRDELLRFSSRFISALIITCAAAMLDTLLWTLFAATFQF